MTKATRLAAELVLTRARKEVKNGSCRSCPRCNTVMKRGIAFAPVTGSANGSKMGHLKGHCLVPNAATVLVPVLKCSECGHSVMFGKLYC